MIVPWCVFLCSHNPECKRDLVYRGESWQKEVVGYNTNKTMCEGGEQVGVAGNPQRTVLAGHNCRVLCLAGCTAKYFFFDFPSVPLRSHSATNPQPHQDFESLTISFGRLNPRSVGGLMGQWKMCNWWKHGKVTKKKLVHVQYVWFPYRLVWYPSQTPFMWDTQTSQATPCCHMVGGEYNNVLNGDGVKDAGSKGR